MKRTFIRLATIAAAASFPSVVTADPACSGLPGRIVYIESADTQESLLEVLGRQLRDTADITLVFNLTGSCTLTSDLYQGATMLPGGALKYIPSTAEDPGWDPTQPEPTCTAATGGSPIDVGIAALFVQSCGLGGPRAARGSRSSRARSRRTRS